MTDNRLRVALKPIMALLDALDRDKLSNYFIERVRARGALAALSANTGAGGEVVELRGALKQLTEAIRRLGKRSSVQPTLTLFEASPTKEQEAFDAWMALNEAQKRANCALIPADPEIEAGTSHWDAPRASSPATTGQEGAIIPDLVKALKSGIHGFEQMIGDPGHALPDEQVILNEMRAAVAKASALASSPVQEAAGWRPIETAALHTEENLLLWVDGHIHEGKYEYMGGSPASGGEWPIFRTPLGHWVAPSHWRPLLASPPSPATSDE